MESLALVVVVIFVAMGLATVLGLVLSGRRDRAGRPVGIVMVVVGTALGLQLLLSVDSLGARVVGASVVTANAVAAVRLAIRG